MLTAHGRLVFRVRRGRCQPAVGAVSQSGSVNLSAYPRKNPLGPLGAKAGHWQEYRVPGVTQQALNTHSCTLIWKAAKDAHIIHNEYIQIVTSV